MSTVDARLEDLIQPRPWGAILSCWFREFHELERARAEIDRLPFRAICSPTLLARIDTVRRLGMIVRVGGIDVNCCRPRRAVIETCTRVVAQHSGTVEARTKCAPFYSDRLPHDYRPIDAARRVEIALGAGSPPPQSGQLELLELSRVFSPRSLDLPAFRHVSVLARRGWSRFLLAEFPASAIGRALTVDARGTIVHATTIDRAVSVGGWEGVGFREADAIHAELYRRSWEDQFELSPRRES